MRSRNKPHTQEGADRSEAEMSARAAAMLGPARSRARWTSFSLDRDRLRNRVRVSGARPGAPRGERGPLRGAEGDWESCAQAEAPRQPTLKDPAAPEGDRGTT